MADITLTAASISIDNDSRIRHGFSSGAIGTGQLVSKGADDIYTLVDTDLLTTAPLDLNGGLYGIALNTTDATGQPLAVAPSGSTVTFGSVLTLNKAYYGSTVAGAISDTAPASTKFGVLVGVAISTTELAVRFQATGIATA